MMQKVCHCGLAAPVSASKMKKNPGRLFWGCSRWQTPEDCGYFEWIPDSIHADNQIEQSGMGTGEMCAIIEKQQQLINALLAESKSREGPSKRIDGQKFNLFCLLGAI